jgi:hypothetical protein
MRGPLGCLLLGAICVLVLLVTGSTIATDLPIEDDFEQVSTDPIPDVWTVFTADGSDGISVVDGMLLTRVISGGGANVQTKESITAQEISVEVDWMMESSSGNSLEVAFLSGSYNVFEENLVLTYTAGAKGWGIRYLRSHMMMTWYSYQNNVVEDVWYRVNLTVRDKWGELYVQRISSGVTTFHQRNWEITPLDPQVKASIGVAARDYVDDAFASYDNFRLFDSTPVELRSIVVDPLPTFEPVEDEPFTIDFIEYVQDPDGDPSDLYLSTTDPHVMGTYRLVATFRFTEGETIEIVALMVTDGSRETRIWAEFHIQWVNDPPHEVIILSPPNHTKVEAGTWVPLIVQAKDVDTGLLTVEWSSNLTGSIHRSNMLDRYEFEASFMDVGTHRVTATVSDGDNEVEAWIIVEVLELGAISGPDTGDVGTGLTLSFMICTIVVIVVIISLVSVASVVSRTRRAKRKESFQAVEAYRSLPQHAPPPIPRPQPRPKPPPSPDEEEVMDLIKVMSGESPGFVWDQPTEVNPVEEAIEETWRVGSVEEFIDILEDLPEGLPQSLWGKDWESLGANVVGTSTRRQDGSIVAFFGGRTYHADKRNLSTFMQEAE